MSDREWQVGDVVRLKSGSPKMTVAGLGNNSASVTCVWFAPDGTEHKCVYPVLVLERVEAAAATPIPSSADTPAK